MVRADHEEVGRVALDDIAAVIASGHGLSYSNNLLVALADRNAVFVLCGPNHVPAGIVWPVSGHFAQAARMDAQLAAGRPLGKRLWQQLVKEKLAWQAALLTALGLPDTPLSALIPRVRSGDPTNVEAQGARRYWPLLFGSDFRRRRDGDGANRLLNYGYAILRAAAARAVAAAGLHPTLGLHHRSGRNPMRLVDDMMEPFRPLVDARVVALVRAGRDTVTADTKKVLAQVMYHDLETDEGTTPVATCIQRAATSLGQVYEGARAGLQMPVSGAPQLAGLLEPP